MDRRQLDPRLSQVYRAAGGSADFRLNLDTIGRIRQIACVSGEADGDVRQRMVCSRSRVRLG
jgi:hypothetical protein